ncbi:recombinase family protein [Paenibacillus larvae]|nr:recombinase family protein [Paenibacillus larvae]MDT2277562.1 recombinase family protein [Paenibacillus larvae]
MGEKEITKHLNENAIPSAKGGTWGITSVQRILQNEIYTGYNVYGKYEIKKVYTNLKNIGDRKRKLVKKDQELWQKSEKRTHPEIISQELYKKAQEIRQIRGGGKRGGEGNMSTFLQRLSIVNIVGLQWSQLVAKNQINIGI